MYVLLLFGVPVAAVAMFFMMISADRLGAMLWPLWLGFLLIGPLFTGWWLAKRKREELEEKQTSRSEPVSMTLLFGKHALVQYGMTAILVVASMYIALKRGSFGLMIGY